MEDKFKFLTSMILKVSEAKGYSKKIMLGVLLVVLILGTIYWFSVLDKEQYLTQRNFRLLNLWSHEISNKIESMSKVSELAFEEIKHPDVFLTGQKFLCDPLNRNGDEPQQPVSKKLSVLKKLCVSDLNNIQFEKAPGEPEKDRPEFLIKLGAEDNTLVFKIEYRQFFENYGSQLILKADLNLSEFVEKLTKEKIFENVLLITKSEENNSGEVIFQRTSKEYSWRNWESLEHNIQEDTWFNFFGNKNGKNEELSKKSSLDLAPHLYYFKSPHGEQFAIFTQPIYFPGKINVSNETFYIAGIVSHEQFRQSYLSISSTALFIAMAILLGLVVALPFIRLSMMGSTDNLKSFHICILLFAMSLGSGLLTILFQDIVFFKTGKQMINKRMETSANSIKEQAETELQQALNTLKHADKNTLKLTGKLKDSDDIEKSDNTKMAWTKDVVICGPDAMIEPMNSDDCYPDYSLLYWMDNQGDMRKNWAAKGFPEYRSPLSLIGREYVSAVLNEEKKLWHIELSKKPSVELNFFLEPIISWSTGINRVVASIKSQKNLMSPEDAASGQIPKQDSEDPHVADSLMQVAALQFEFLSLMKDVVVPPGIGFVVVNKKDSKVLFHSSEQRALRENFLVETDNNQMLENLILAGESGHVEGRYWGHDKHFFVLPFDDVPWTLIVYQNSEILDSASLVALVIAASLFTLWVFIIFCIPWFAGWVLRGRYYLEKKWFWPNQNHHKSYRILSIFNCLLFLIGLFICWMLDIAPEWLLFVCFVISLIALITSFIVFRYNNNNAGSNTIKTSGTRFFSLLNYPYSFSTMISSYLLVFSVLPAIGIMSAVHQKEMTAVVKHQLLKLHQELNDTAKPVVKFCQDQSATDNTIFQLSHYQPQVCLKHENQVESKYKYGLFGFYPDFLLKSKWDISQPIPENSENNNTLLDAFYQKVSYYFIPLKKGINNWGLITEKTNNGSVYWSVKDSEIKLHGDLRTRIVDSYQPKYPEVKDNDNWENVPISATAKLPIQTLQLGDWFKLQNWYTFLLYGVLICIWVSFIYKTPQITANNTLFLFRPKRRNAELPLVLNKLLLTSTPNLIVVGFPGQGKARKIQQLINDKKEAHHIYLNLRHVSDQNWISFVELQKAKCPDASLAPIIIVDQFEFRCNEPLINQKKLELLETLQYPSIAGTHCHVHVISNVYPGLFPLDATELIAEDEAHGRREILSARWHTLWDTFRFVYYAMDDKESDHCQYNQWLSSELGDQKLHPKIWKKMSEDFLRPYYQAIWQSATLDEQLALYNLVRDQFIHVKHPGLNSLLCKGLIHFSPNLSLMDDRFASFVKYAGKRDQLDQFAKSHREGNWSIIKVPLGITFVIFFAFLAITQEEFRSIFPALISVLPVLFQGMPDLNQVFKGSDKN
jgi:hypothetical protein